MEMKLCVGGCLRSVIPSAEKGDDWGKEMVAILLGGFVHSCLRLLQLLMV